MWCFRKQRVFWERLLGEVVEKLKESGIEPSVDLEDPHLVSNLVYFPSHEAMRRIGVETPAWPIGSDGFLRLIREIARNPGKQVTLRFGCKAPYTKRDSVYVGSAVPANYEIKLRKHSAAMEQYTREMADHAAVVRAIKNTREYMDFMEVYTRKAKEWQEKEEGAQCSRCSGGGIVSDGLSCGGTGPCPSCGGFGYSGTRPAQSDFPSAYPFPPEPKKPLVPAKEWSVYACKEICDCPVASCIVLTVSK